MQWQEHLDMIWLIYYAAGALFMVCAGLLTWRVRFAFFNVWFPFLMFVLVFVPLRAGESGGHAAPMIGVWLMAFFGA